MLRRFYLISFIFLVFLTTSGAGCLSSNQQSKEQVTLTMWGLFDSAEVYTPIIKDFQSDHSNIKINYIKKDYNEYELNTSEALAAGEGPDIWMIRNDWMPRHYKKLVPMTSGLLATKNKTDLDIFKSTFPQVAVDDLVVDDKVYGIPPSIDTLVLYYNRGIFRERKKELEDSGNLSDAAKLENPPATWEDVIAYDKLFTKKDGNNITRAGIALGTAANVERSQDILAALMLQNHTSMVSADKKTATFNLTTSKASGELVYPGTSALDFYSSFANSGKENYTWSSSMPNSLQAFMDGKTTMMIHYGYIGSSIKQNRPTLDLATGPLPQIKGVTDFVDYVSYYVNTVSNNSKHAKEAWEFINYLASSGNGMYTSATGRPSPALPQSDLVPTNIDGRLSTKSQALEYQKASAQSWYKGIRSDKVDNIFYQMIDSVSSKGQPSQSAINTAASQVTALFQAN